MKYQTNIHVYGSPLVIGDAELIVNKIKKDEFRDEWNKDKHISLPDYGSKERKIKECNYFDLYSGGGCYTPIFSKKNTNFSIYELSASGNSKLNKIINNRLNNYKGSDGKRKFSLTLETHLNKEIVLRDSKGNPKTYRINLLSNISIKDFDGTVKNKSFSKSVDYNNKSNKSNLKKYENETSKNLAEKIADEIIIYLGSI